jgi:PAS domain S-box-containing protein
MDKREKADELILANKELIFQNEEKEKRAAELVIANIELAFQNEEKEKRAAELIIANKELLFQNIEKEKRAEELISANKELDLTKQQQDFDNNNLNALINNTGDLMWSVDKDFKLITSNKPFNDIIKLISGNVITKGSDVLTAGFPMEQLERYKKFYNRAFAGETFTEIEYSKLPVEFWSEISFNPICNGDEVIGTACHSRDITRRKKAEEERERMIEDMVQRNRDLEQFAFIISHNLRAPTANIIGFTDNLQDETISAKVRKKFLQGLSFSVLRLDTIIKDINKILQVKREADEKKELISFTKLVNDIFISIGNLIDKYRVRIKTEFSQVDEIYSLKGYMHSIFYNLITNSIKYQRPDEEPLIEISSRKENGKTILTFKDNGLGIDLKKRGDKVFGLYKRFHVHVEGKGMGLFMVKTQVELLGGKISIISEVNKGTEFKIEFKN